MASPLAKIPLFDDLPSERLERLGREMSVVRLDAGDVLFREGDPGEHLYVIDEGQLDVLRGAGSPEELVLRTLVAGDYFGDMALVAAEGRRTATVRARTPASLRALGRAEFDRLLTEFPLLARVMVRVLTRRLDASNTATFQDLTEKNRKLQTAYDDLKAAHEQIVEKERLEKELSVAATIQRSILPGNLDAIPGLDCGALLEPARHVGGDFYDVFPLDDRRVGFLIGDVAGKGVPSAIYMGRVHAFLVSEADRGSDPGDVLRGVNSRLMRLERETQFVTVLYGVLDRAEGRFSYARAGHAPPVLISPDGETVSLPHASGMAIGAWDELVLDERTVTLEPGSTLLLYTDGLLDCRDPAGEAFGLDRALAELRRLRGLNAASLCTRLGEALRSFRRGAPPDDDVTLLAARIPGGSGNCP